MIKSFIQSITSKKEKEYKDNILAFITDQNLDASINVFFNACSDEDAKKFGKLLHRLNSGQFEESIFNFLKEKMDGSEPNKDFVNKVLWYWGVESYSDSIDHNNDKPFISPTDFSKVIQK